MKEKKRNILVIDDDKSVLRVFTRILEKNGYNVETAETGKEAEEKTRDGFCDLVLIDMKLPDIDGIELLRRINAINPKMIKIIITGFPSMDDGIKALDSGADAYIVKPIKPEELVRTIREKIGEQA